MMTANGFIVMESFVMESFDGMTLKERIGGHETWGNEKNRDIGYALAANSCERVSDVDTCTVAVPDAISAFAVPNPGASSAEPSVFSGLAVERVAPP